MPFYPPYVSRIGPRSQREVDPRSLELYDPDKLPRRRGLLPETMQNPEYWPDDTTTHIFPEERNPTRREGVQKISAGNIFGEGQRGGIFGTRVDPALLRELEKRAEAKRQMAQGLEAAAEESSFEKQLASLNRSKIPERNLPIPFREGLAGTAGEMLYGVPVAGPALLGLGERMVAGKRSLMEGKPYSQALEEAQTRQEQFRRQQPRISESAQAGGSALLAPAFGASVPAQMIGNAALGGADAMVRGQDPRYAAGEAALAAMVPIPGARKGIRAYHGSPHDFERFDASKIGTGEGAQAYGHGLYFAEREGVARDYRDKLSAKWSPDLDKDPAVLARYLMDGNTKEGALLGLQLRKDQWKGRPSAYPDNYGSVLDEAIRFVETDSIPPAGRMYEVDIAAEPEQFLDWDKPLAEQSPHVSGGLDQILKSRDRMPAEWIKSSPGAEQRMQEAGIPGIRYLDQGSRGPATIYNVGSPRADFGPYSPYTNRADAEEQLKLLRRMGETDAEIKEQAQPQSRNYVIFPGNEKLISILKKYGLPISAAGLATLMQLHPEEAKAAQKKDRK